MNKILFIIAISLSLSVSAQVSSSYIFTQAPGTFNAVTGGILLGNTATDDERFVDPAVPLGGTATTGPGFSIGFNFIFNNETFDRVGINANGWISFGKSADGLNAINMYSSSYYSPISATSNASPVYKQNRISALGRDLAAQTGASLRIETIGSAPNRVCVIQWSGFRKYNASGDNFYFQIRLNETINSVQVVYGIFSSNSTNGSPQVGLRGSTNSDYNNRTGSDWSASTAGTSNTSAMTLNTSSVPSPGLTYSWSLPSGPQNPASFTVSAISSTQLNSAWQLNLSGNDVMLAFNTVNTFGIPVSGTTYTNGSLIPGGGTVLYNGNQLSFSHTGLNPSTIYYYKLWSKDGSTAYSTGITASAYTLCSSVNSYPYNYDFEAVLNNCWSIQQVSGSGNWGMAASMTDPVLTPQSGTHMARFRSFDFDPGTSSRLKSPVFNFSLLTMPALEFYMSQDNGYPDANDSIIVEISTNAGTDWTELSPSYKRYNAGTTGSWRFIRVNLEAYSGNPSVMIGFKAVSAYGNNMAIDNVTIKQMPPMTYVSSTTTQTVTSAVYPGFTNQQIIGIQVVTINPGSPFNAAGFTFTTNGSTNPPADISNAKLFYTGTSNTFQAVNQFGFVNSPNGSFVVNGLQQLTEGNNYFWLTYDISPSAAAGDFVDAECSQISFSGSVGIQVPSVQAPAGNRLIASSVTSVNVGAGETYTSLTNPGGLFEAINNGTLIVAANLSAIVTSSLNETGTISLNQWAYPFSVTIIPSSASEKLITGNISTKGLITIDGADNVTIDGRFNGSGKFFRIRNTSSQAPAVKLFNDAKNFTLRNCIIESSNSNDTETLKGSILIGKTQLTEGNDNAGILNCDIRNRTDVSGFPRFGIVSLGSTTTTQANNSGINITGCSIFNYKAEGYAAGILLDIGSGENSIIANNSFYKEEADSVDCAWHGILLKNGTYGNINITGNFIGGSAPYCGGSAFTSYNYSFMGIYVWYNTYNSGNNVISSNKIKNINLNSPASGQSWIDTMICIRTMSCNINFNSNEIGDTNSTGNINCGNIGICGIFAINSEYMAVENNTMGSIYSSGTGTIELLQSNPLQDYMPLISHTIRNNKFGSINTAGSINNNTGVISPYYSQTRVIECFGSFSGGSITISKNIFSSITGNTRSVTSCIDHYDASSGGTVFNIDSNIFSNISSSDVYGVKINSPSTGPVSMNIRDNQFNDIYGNIAGLSAIGQNSLTRIENNNLNIYPAGGSYGIHNYFHSSGIYVYGSGSSAKHIIKGNTVSLKVRQLSDNGGNKNFDSMNDISSNRDYDLPSIMTIIGLYSAGNDSSRIYNNTIYMEDNQNTNISTYAYYRDNAGSESPKLHIANNIFINKLTGTGPHYVIGISQPAQNWTAGGIDYNLFINNNPLLFSLFGSDISFSQWKTNSGCDKNSYYALVADLNPLNLFVDAANNNLHINFNNTEAWAVSGKGIGLSYLSNDIDGNHRSTSVSGGVVDIGADEFTQTPPLNPALIQQGVPGPGATTTYFLYNRPLVQITWGSGGSSYPAGMNINYYSGINNPNITGGSHANSYFSIIPAGVLSGAAYDIKMFFGENETYSIQSPSVNSVLSKFEGTWSVFPPGSGNLQSELDWVNKSVTVRGLTAFSDFVLTDYSNPLPVELSEFSAAVTGRDVKLKWKTNSEINNRGFEIERRTVTKPGEFTRWQNLKFVEGMGNTNSETAYEYTDRKLPSGKYQYRLKQFDYIGNYEYYSLAGDVSIIKPDKFELSQNYPNPSNPSCKIDFMLPFKGRVSLIVYDILGREITTLIDKELEADYYTSEFNGSNFASGVYFYRLIAEGSGEKLSKTMKMILVK